VPNDAGLEAFDTSGEPQPASEAVSAKESAAASFIRQVNEIPESRRLRVDAFVRGAVARTVNIHVDALPPGGSLEECGLDSLALLDLQFRIEKAVALRVPWNCVAEVIRADLGVNAAEDVDGRLSGAARELLAELMPEASDVIALPGITLDTIQQLYSVETLVRIVSYVCRSAVPRCLQQAEP
jgi:hypothetical protein